MNFIRLILQNKLFNHSVSRDWIQLFRSTLTFYENQLQQCT